MKCRFCEYCVPDELNPETLNVTYFCLFKQTEIHPESYCLCYVDRK